MRSEGTAGVALALFLGSALGACGGDGDDDGTGTGAAGTGTAGTGAAGGAGGGGPAFVEPAAETQAIWPEMEGYAAWPTFAENTEPEQSATHEGMFVLTRYNEIVAGAVESGALPLEDGAILVKDNFAKPDDPTPMAVTVMAKRHGGWYWFKASPDGKVFAGPDGKGLEGKDVGMCVECHSGASDNDHVFTHTFAK